VGYITTHQRDLIVVAHLNAKALHLQRAGRQRRCLSTKVDALTFLAMGYSRAGGWQTCWRNFGTRCAPISKRGTS
jgi:hypothetical protein